MQCKWCKKDFRSERTLSSHLCVKKRRWSDKDLTHIRLAHRVFQMFYKLTTNSTKPKTQEDFIHSQFYTDFVKFGRSCVRNEYLDPEQFAEWLIRNGVKLKNWSADSTYDKYLVEYVQREPGLRALERSIIYLSSWQEENHKAWNTYFREISTNRAVYDIRAAKVSPWLIYLSATGGELLEKFNDEQVSMVQHIIDANVWMKIFQKNQAEVDEVEEVCRAAGI